MTDYLTDVNNDIVAYFETHDIPTYFYQCLFGELVKVWGIKPLIPDKDYLAEYDDNGNIIPSNDESYSYKDQIDYFFSCEEGTVGWFLAFKDSCELCNLMNMYEDYQKLDLVRSDYFDDYIKTQMIEFLFSKHETDEYYKFRLKEN